MICRECGVELDETMDECPLCGWHLSGQRGRRYFLGSSREQERPRGERPVVQQLLWQITCVLLISGIASTLIINLSIHGAITWSIYPVTVCLVLLTYAALKVLWQTKTTLLVLAGWAISGLLLLFLDRIIDGDWPIALAFPILSVVNFFALVLHFISVFGRKKSLNLVALVFLAIAVVCIFIDGIVSHYLTDVIRLSWSVIVAACLIPVTGTILFMHFRMRNNTELEKIFHT